MGGVAVLSGLATLVVVVLTHAAWDTCNVGGNGSANLMTLAVVAPGLFLVALALGAGVRRVIPGLVLAFVGVALILAGLAALALVYGATPEAWADPVCPANVPPWWPAWLPS